VNSNNSGTLPNGKDVHGMYSGMLPCADCEQIELVLSLGDDMTWQTSLKYIGKSDNTNRENGKYHIREDGVIVLDRTDEGMKYFVKVPRGIRMLDVNGQRIYGELADLYILKLLTGSQMIPLHGSKGDILRDKLSQGIDFYATGSKPSWKLELDFEKTFKFSSVSGIELHSLPVESENPSEEGVIVFRTLTESGDMVITLIEQVCTDEMTGAVGKFGVEVKLRNAADKNFRVYKGCGNYLRDERLYDIWALEMLKDDKIYPEDFSKGLPVLEINTHENLVTGHDGCNSLSGSIETHGNHIIFGDLMSTLMACPEMELGSRFTQTLSGKKLRFEIKNNNLLLFDGDMNAVTLKHVD
jgi:heat shock protein HslJ